MTTQQKNMFQNLKQVDPLTLTFTLSPTHHVYANTLRRAVMTEVETVGFRSDMNPKDGTTTDVIVQYNNTPMTNEMLADRIGLLPIWVSKPLEWDASKYRFDLDVKNEGDDSLDVTCANFRVMLVGNPGEDPTPFEGGNKEFFHPNPLTGDTALIAVLKGKLLNQNPQSIQLVAHATVGKGRDHVRFNPVSQCSYKNTINEDEEEQKKYFEKWLRSTKNEDPKKLEKEEEARNRFWREFQTMEVERCFLKNEAGEPYSYDFTIESKGVLSVPYIVSRALEALQQKCLTYASLEKTELDTVKIKVKEARGPIFDFLIQNEDHTLGQLLQTWMDQNLMDKEEITFAGAMMPHPLRKELLVSIGVKDGNETTARAMFSKAAKGCAAMFKVWKENWDELTAGRVPTAPAPVPRNRNRTFKLAPGEALPPAEAAPQAQPQPTGEVAKAAAAAKKKERDPRRGAFWQNPL